MDVSKLEVKQENLQENIPSQEEINQELARRHLKEFMQYFWHTVEPAQFCDNWHLDMICDHLEAVTRGDIKRLVINIPPRHSKSLLTSVFWPAWTWLQDPSMRFLFSSYSSQLSIRDSIKCRRIIECEDYKDTIHIPYPDWRITSDVATKIRYETNKGGVRLATSTLGALTGEGGDVLCVDDPHNVIQGKSDPMIQQVLDWWDTALSTRLNDVQTGRIVVIMQRIGDNDLVGHIQKEHEKHGDWEFLILPARYEGYNRTETSLGSVDPRGKKGEVLWPAKWPDFELAQLEDKLGRYGTAAQLQQRPSPREGGMFNITKIKERMTLPPKAEILKSIRYWDKAGSEEDYGSETAGVLMHKLKNGKYLIADVIHGKWSWGERERIIKETAAKDGIKVHVWIEQEGGSGGKESAQRTISELAGYAAYKDRVTGDKVTRAEGLAAQTDNDNVEILTREWTNKTLEELKLFPNAKKCDIVDASTGAFNKLVNTNIAGAW